MGLAALMALAVDARRTAAPMVALMAMTAASQQTAIQAARRPWFGCLAGELVGWLAGHLMVHLLARNSVGRVTDWMFGWTDAWAA